MRHALPPCRPASQLRGRSRALAAARSGQERRAQHHRLMLLFLLLLSPGAPAAHRLVPFPGCPCCSPPAALSQLLCPSVTTNSNAGVAAPLPLSAGKGIWAASHFLGAEVTCRATAPGAHLAPCWQMVHRLPAAGGCLAKQCVTALFVSRRCPESGSDAAHLPQGHILPGASVDAAMQLALLPGGCKVEANVRGGCVPRPRTGAGRRAVAISPTRAAARHVHLPRRRRLSHSRRLGPRCGGPPVPGGGSRGRLRGEVGCMGAMATGLQLRVRSGIARQGVQALTTRVCAPRRQSAIAGACSRAESAVDLSDLGLQSLRCAADTNRCRLVQWRLAATWRLSSADEGSPARKPPPSYVPPQHPANCKQAQQRTPAARQNRQRAEHPPRNAPP